MKKPLKIIRNTFLTVLVLIIGYVFYMYATKPFISALYNNDESKLFYRPSTELQGMETLKFTEQALKVNNSNIIYSYVFTPTTAPKAAIFLIRGNSGNVSTSLQSIKPLVENGFKVYTLDWRGYGKSTGVPTYKGILQDTEVAFSDFLVNTKTDSVKTIVYGMSLGGQVAVKIAKDNQNNVDALILDGSIASAHSFIADYTKGSLLQLVTKKAEAYNQDYIAVRDIADIKNMPKLIIHSNIDRAVSFDRGQSIFEAALAPKEFWETNTDHIKTLEVLPSKTIEKINELIR